MLHVGMPELNQWDIQILGTDISNEAIQKAHSGKYNQQEIQQGLPEKLRAEYF